MRTQSSGKPWLIVAMAAIIFILGLSVEKTQAGHGDVEDAASCNASIADRLESLWTAHSIIRQIRQLGTVLVDASSMVIDDDVAAIIKQDFEMRLCECRTMWPEFSETEKSEVVATAMMGPLEASLEPRFRFTRDDLLRPFRFPGGSFVSTLNLEEYRPYDIMDSQMIRTDTLVVPVPADPVPADPVPADVDQFDSVAHDPNRQQSGEDAGVLLNRLWKQLTTSCLPQYDWISHSGLETAKIASLAISEIHQRVRQHAKFQLINISSHAQRIGGEALGFWFTSEESRETFSNPPRPVHEDAAETVQLRQVFGSCVLADPLNATVEFASIRPPMLVDSALVDPALVPTMRDEQTTMVAENKSWQMIILLQEPSWGLSDQSGGLLEREAASKNQDAKSASLTENPGHGVSQR